MKKAFFTLSALAIIFSVSSIQAQDLKSILGQLEPSATKAVYNPEYKFDTYLQMEISDPGSNTIAYDLYSTKDGSSFAVLIKNKESRSVILFDTKNSALLMLVDAEGEKTGVAMGVDPETLAEMTTHVESTNKDYSEFKTGKTKAILDYTCDEYLIQENGTEISMWASERLGKEVAKEILAAQGIFGGAFTHAAGVRGMVLEYNQKEKNSAETRTLKITKISLDANYFVTVSEYAVMSMGQ